VQSFMGISFEVCSYNPTVELGAHLDGIR
jgi:hypothetical protein